MEEMTGAAKRLADLWHKQTLAQMALVQAGTSQDVAAKMQQLQVGGPWRWQPFLTWAARSS